MGRGFDGVFQVLEFDVRVELGSVEVAMAQ